MAKKSRQRTGVELTGWSFNGNGRAELGFFLICALVPILIWTLFLGWKPSEVLGSHDNTLALLQFKLLSEGGNWRRALYQWWNFGGGDLIPLTGVIPLTQLLLWLGISPESTLTILNFFGHSLCGYLGGRLVIEIAVWNAATTEGSASIQRFSLPREISLAALFCFLPFFAWRIPYGHLLIVAGNWAYLGFLLLLISAANRTLSRSLIALVTLAMLQILPALSAQTLIYSIVFGFPLLVFVLTSKNSEALRTKNRRHLLAICAIPLIAFFISSPLFWLMFRFATGSEAMRSLNAEPVIYSYVTSTLRDWISSLPWSFAPTTLERQDFLHHEVNYPIGPLLIPFLVLSRRRAPVMAVLGSIAAIIALASHWPIVSDVILKTAPILKSFRVPARAFVLMTWLISIFGVANLIEALSIRPKRAWNPRDAAWIFIPLLLLVIGATEGDPWRALAREALLWGVIGTVSFFVWLERHRKSESSSPSSWPISRVLTILALGAVLSFQDRRIPNLRRQEVETLPRMIHDEIIRKMPEATSPLHRVFLMSQLPSFQVNTGAIAGLGQLSGYFAAPKRFLTLAYGLRSGQPPDPSTSVYASNPEAPESRIVATLYNTRTIASFENQQWNLRPYLPAIENGASPAWISKSVRRIGGWPELWSTLKATDSAGAEAWKALRENEALVLDSDAPIESQALPCQWNGAPPTVLPSTGSSPAQEIALQVEGTQGNCILTVATTYSPSLRVRSGSHELRTFPSYGALLGVVLTAENTREPLRIRSDASIPLAIDVLRALALLALALLLIYPVWRTQELE